MAIPRINNYSISSLNINYENKPNWKVDPARCVLLIHDMQRYFLNFYGENSSSVDELIKAIGRLKSWCRHQNIPCVYTAQPGNQSIKERALLNDFWGGGVDDKGELTDIENAIKPEGNDVVFTKWRYSAFKKNNFQDWLVDQGRDQILICGVYGHIGILSTALEALMLDIKPFVVSDAIADFTVEDHEMTLNYVSRRCGVVVSSSELTDLDLTKLKREPKSNKKNVASPVEKKIDNNTQFSPVALRKEIADLLILEENDIQFDDDLMSWGIDSMRVVHLIERWQSRGLRLDYSEFIENLRISHWSKLLQQASGGDNVPLGNEREERDGRGESLQEVLG